MKPDAIDAVIAELRAVYPELAEPLTWSAMTAILQREGIALLTLPLVHDAQVISCDGVSVMAINSNAPPARHTYYAAHEWGHIKLHFTDPGEIVYHTSACWPDDPREDDAEHFATALLMGPQRYAVSAAATCARPATEGTVTRHNDAGDDRPIIHRPQKRGSIASPAQTMLPLPEPASPYGQFDHNYHKIDPEDAVRALLKRTSPRLKARLVARDRAEKAAREIALDIRPRVEFVKEGRERKHYFVDRDGHRWRIWDFIPPGRKSTAAKNVRVEPPHNWATERAFVAADGTRRRYMFRYREAHELETQHLERQLAAAATCRDRGSK